MPIYKILMPNVEIIKPELWNAFAWTPGIVDQFHDLILVTQRIAEVLEISRQWIGFRIHGQFMIQEIIQMVGRMFECQPEIISKGHHLQVDFLAWYNQNLFSFFVAGMDTARLMAPPQWSRDKTDHAEVKLEFPTTEEIQILYDS